jgi:hypothetical protein
MRIQVALLNNRKPQMIRKFQECRRLVDPLRIKSQFLTAIQVSNEKLLHLLGLHKDQSSATCPGRTATDKSYSTVDGRNPAPPWMVETL